MVVAGTARGFKKKLNKTMKHKVYNYKTFKLKPAEKNLEFRKNNYRFLSKLSEVFKEVKTDEELGDKMIDFLHNEDNLRSLFSTFLEKESADKIDYNFEDDGNYEAVIALAGGVLRDFFSAKAKSLKRSTS